MSRRISVRWVLSAVALSATVTACASSPASPGASTPQSRAPSPPASQTDTPSVTATQTATASPTQTARPTVAAVASPTPSPTTAGSHLTYVALGDSLLYALEGDCASCTSAAVIYGKQIATDLGMPVEVHNLTMHNGLVSAGLLGYLKNGAMIGRQPEDVLLALMGADIVTVTIGFNDIGFDARANVQALLTAFETNLDGILTRIDALRAGKPTVLRVTQIYNNGIGASPASDPDGPGTGIDFWKPTTEAQNEAICRVAAAHKAVCVDIYHPLNGEDGTSSPAAKGFLGPDGIHPSQLGMDAIAAALAAAGYKPLH